MCFVTESATMEVRALGFVPVVDAAGPEMDRAESVTVFQELVTYAPGAIVDAPATWSSVDDHSVKGAFTLGVNTVEATLVFDDGCNLVEVISDDRLRASADGRSFTVQPWSTPVQVRRAPQGQVVIVGEGRWHAPEPEGTFTYLEISVDGASGVAASGSTHRGAPVRSSWGVE